MQRCKGIPIHHCISNRTSRKIRHIFLRPQGGFPLAPGPRWMKQASSHRPAPGTLMERRRPNARLAMAECRSRWSRRSEVLLLVALLLCIECGATATIKSTLDGPFAPVTVPFAFRGAPSADLPGYDPRVVKRVEGVSPDQIMLALSTPDAMWLSWITGDSQLGPKVTPLDPSSVASVVQFGTESGNLIRTATGSSLVYSQSYPFAGVLNYTSGIIHHVRLTGLASGTVYFYKCGDPGLDAMSPEYHFTTLPAPGPASYPKKIAFIGDLGLTYNSTTTFDHMRQNEPDLLLIVGDLSYANLYITNGTGSACYDCAFGDTPIRETYQPRWDYWGRFLEPFTRTVPMMVIEGNHEYEKQQGNVTFASYRARFAVPYSESGSPTSLYYSFDAAGVHFLMLAAYDDYRKASRQYAWAERDLAGVDRAVTPWLVAVWHPPWYNSYNSHYREFECMRLQMEELLYSHGVDIVVTGHVHAYERMNRVYNYALDPCGLLHITVGDGGNRESMSVPHADEEGGCPSPQESAPVPEDVTGLNCAFNFTTGPAAGRFCWDRQPEWSALREASFGHGILEVKNATHALWTWHRNQDAFDDPRGDQIYIVRQPGVCPNQPKASLF